MHSDESPSRHEGDDDGARRAASSEDRYPHAFEHRSSNGRVEGLEESIDVAITCLPYATVAAKRIRRTDPTSQFVGTACRARVRPA